MYPARVIVSTHKVHFSLRALYFCKLPSREIRSFYLLSRSLFRTKRPRHIMWTRDEGRKKTVKKIGREKLTDCAIAHPVYMTILLCSTQPDGARSASISYGNFFKNPRRNWSKKLDIGSEGRERERERKKAEFPRISGIDAIHGIEDTCGGAPYSRSEPKNDVKIERYRTYRWRVLINT